MKNYYSNNTRQSGFTLIEVLVAIGLFTIIVTIAIGGFTNALRTQREVASLIATQSNVSLALEQMTREMRTGYLFCHAQGADTPDPSCGCTLSDSGFNPISAENASTPTDYSQDASGNGDYDTWTCSAIDYYAADGTHVIYSRSTDGGLIRGVIDDADDSIATSSITGDNVNVQDLSFLLFGNIEGDTWNPRITIAIGVSPSSTDVATMNDVLHLQTTVSSRNIDCTDPSGSSPASC